MKIKTFAACTALTAALILLSGCGRNNTAPAGEAETHIEMPAVTEPAEGPTEELTEAEAKELINALNTVDKIGACAVAYDNDIRYEDKKGNVYYKVSDPYFTDTAALNEYMNTYLTQDFIMQRYFNIFDGETPMCIDLDGSLYINYAPKGGGFAFTPDAPEIKKDPEGGYSVVAAYDNYGAKDNMEIKVLYDDGRYKIDDVVLNIAQAEEKETKK